MYLFYATFDVIAAVMMRLLASLNMTPCRLVYRYQRYGGGCTECYEKPTVVSVADGRTLSSH